MMDATKAPDYGGGNVLVTVLKSKAKKRGSKYEPSPTAVKEFKKNWKAKPFPLWPNDFKPAEAKAA